MKCVDFCLVFRLEHSLSQMQSRVESTGGMTAQAAQVRAADETIPAHEEGNSVSLKTFSLDTYTEENILVLIFQLVDAKHPLHGIEQQHRTSFFARSDPVSTTMPGG